VTFQCWKVLKIHTVYLHGSAQYGQTHRAVNYGNANKEAV